MDGRTYTLTEHRELPEDERPVWTLVQARHVDGARAQAYCSAEFRDLKEIAKRGAALEPGDAEGSAAIKALRDEANEARTLLWMAARTGSQVRGVTRHESHRKMRGPCPTLAQDRIRWFLRLPTQWISELQLEASRDAELDPEEE